MKDYARRFYFSSAWRNTSRSYAKSVGRLCERCLNKGIIKAGQLVHHKIPITPDNINDEKITLNWDNLQLLCRDCHAQVHEEIYVAKRRKRRYTVDENGRVTANEIEK